MGSWPCKSSAITLFVEDPTKAFYQEVFGLPVHFQDDVSAVFDFGNTLINLLQADEAPELIAPRGAAIAASRIRSALVSRPRRVPLRPPRRRVPAVRRGRPVASRR